MDTTKTRSGRSCRLCQQPLGRIFVDLGMSPLCESYVQPEHLNEMERFYPLCVFICESCLLVQLDEYVAPADIFGEYAYFSSYSDSWVQHAKGYVDMVSGRFDLGDRNLVAEIASNDGYLLQHFIAKGIPCLGIEPAANVARVAIEKGIPTVVRFFGTDAARDIVNEYGHAALVLGNNVLAHVPALNDFVGGMKVLLAPRGVITVEVPHIVHLMEENQFDTIYHEHFSYFSLLTATRAFARNGLAVFDVEKLPTHGGSLRIFAKHVEDNSKEETRRLAAAMEAEEKAGYHRLEAYLRFSERVKATKRNLLEFLIDAKEEGRSIAGYGAPGKGNTLLNYCGIGTDFLDYTVDRNTYKQGKYTPGTRIPIFDPSRLEKTRPDYILILPWNIRDEIAKQIAYARTWGAKFAVPIPRVEVF